MRALGIMMIVVGVLGFVVGGCVSLVTNISLESSIGGLKDRAQVSADAEEIHLRLVELDQRMEERGMDSGYTALFVHSPWTSVREIRKNIQTLIKRADVISQLDHSSDAYQQGLDDVRGTLRELDVQAFGWWIYSGGGWVFLYLFIIGGILLAGVGVVVSWIAFGDY
ncbi:MAG: hypothetical protein HY457_03155 [Parcubacteria group bacterium]|nr:hypothetical protein [Parcubacteria group bacterium]